MSLDDFKLLTKADAAAIFGVCPKTIDNYIREGRLPPPVQFASREYWHPADFQAFLDDTFRRSKSVGPADTQHAEDEVQEAESVRPPRTSKVAHDSSPAVRQQRRQQEKLRRLNSSA